MKNDSDKYPTLDAMRKRATEKQPDEIHLVAAPQHTWVNATIDAHAAGFASLGFMDAGTYTVDTLPVAIRFFLKESERMYATIYEHPKAGMWINIVILFED